MHLSVVTTVSFTVVNFGVVDVVPLLELFPEVVFPPLVVPPVELPWLLDPDEPLPVVFPVEPEFVVFPVLGGGVGFFGVTVIVALLLFPSSFGSLAALDKTILLAVTFAVPLYLALNVTEFGKSVIPDTYTNSCVCFLLLSLLYTTVTVAFAAYVPSGNINDTLKLSPSFTDVGQFNPAILSAACTFEINPEANPIIIINNINEIWDIIFFIFYRPLYFLLNFIFVLLLLLQLIL